MCIELIQMNQQGSSENIHSCIFYSQVALQTGMFGIFVARYGGFDDVYEFLFESTRLAWGVSFTWFVISTVCSCCSLCWSQQQWKQWDLYSQNMQMAALLAFALGQTTSSGCTSGTGHMLFITLIHRTSCADTTMTVMFLFLFLCIGFQQT